jgi:hypothetical protein
VRLEGYLGAAVARLRVVLGVRGLAALLAGALIVTLLAGWYLERAVPGTTLVTLLRVLAYGALAACVIAILMRLKRLGSDADAVAAVERRVSSFGGRLTTLRDARRRDESGPLLPLLERECTQIAQRFPPELFLPRRDWLVPATAAVAATAALALLLSPLTGHLGQAAQRLWFGELFSAGAPRIVASPGDVVVPRGFDVVIEAQALGFQAPAMTVHASFESGGGWQEASMSRLGEDRYGFVFVAVGEDIDYYLRSRSVRSERYHVQVADLPRVTSVQVRETFPDWTGLPVAERSDGDVDALPGTRVEVHAALDRPADEVLLVVNGEARESSQEEGGYRGSFVVEAPGRWFVAVPHRGTLARISDLFDIRVRPDQPPEVTYAWPGRDRQATPIEEVAMEFRADDDFGVESLLLGYSVNGGPWQTVPLDPSDAHYLLALEALRRGDAQPLAPGDVISLYVEAADHAQRTRSPLYFVDVRPFDRRYRESQQSGGAEGAAGGDLEIAQRQREILTATWNLINKQTNGAVGDDDVEREARVVAMLQGKLSEQVNVLIERVRARGLGGDDGLNEFVESLTRAAEVMPPAASRLEALELSEAVPIEQQALAHLRAADASVRDIDVARIDDSRGRGTSGESLSELVDLEMDTERNRYESPQTPDLGAEQPGQAPEWEQLEELAARQQQLESGGRRQESLASRWQREQLERELEEMRRALEQRRDARGGTNSRELGEAIERLEQARQSLAQSAQPGSPGTDVSEPLQDAADALRRQALDDRRQRLANAQSDAQALLRAQEDIMDRLEATQERSLNDSLDRRANPWQDFSMAADAGTKRRMRDTLHDLRRQLADTVGELGADDAAAEVLKQALLDLDDDRVEERLATAAEAFEMGRPLFVLGHEEIVRRALSRLGDQLDDAGARLDGGSAAGEDPDARVQALRRALAAAREGSTFDRSALESVAEQVEALRFELGSELDFASQNAAYTRRGLNTDDPAALYRLTLESLDMLDVSLRSAEGPGIEAERTRSAARDSAAAAEYFRRLGETDPETMESDADLL